MPFDLTVAYSEVEIEDLPEISLHAFAGSVRPQTMRVTAWLKGKVNAY